MIKVKTKKNLEFKNKKNNKSEKEKRNPAKTELNILKSDKGGDIVLHPAAYNSSWSTRATNRVGVLGNTRWIFYIL